MLHPADLRQRLRAALDPAPVDVAPAGDRLAAVLVPLIEGAEPALIFTVRAAALSRHAGEISFPGGIVDPGESSAEAALREAREEIGLDPSALEVLGALPPVHTHVSGILVVPFVAALAAAPSITANEAEIEEVLVFSVTRLGAAERPMELARPEGGVWRGWAYELEGHTIWGATGWMLHTLLDVMRKETPWVPKDR
jgi:8-oxo-dGTP pyrophosphatase MutT (NUDIX family)